MFSIWRYLLAYVFVFSIISFTDPLEAAVIVVNPGDSIQTAINSANNGDTIQISAGIYVEQILIQDKTLNIVGAGQDLTTIAALPSSTHLPLSFIYSGVNWFCVVIVDNTNPLVAQEVNISNLTVSGRVLQGLTYSYQQDAVPPYGASDRFFAIGYHNVSGTVSNVRTTQTTQSSNFNELAGGGIVNASDADPITFNVNNCLVDFYQRIGIDCRGVALTANITNTVVKRNIFHTPNTNTAAPNGIQFSSSAKGSIKNSSISENISTQAGTQSTGILLFQAGADIVVEGNTTDLNDISIIGINVGNNLTIRNNTVNFTPSVATPVNTLIGIAIQKSNSGDSTVSSNIMNNIPDINMSIEADSSQIFNLSRNQFIGSQTGMLVTGIGSDGPKVIMDSDSFTSPLDFYIYEVDSPNNIWPSTASVSFDGLISGQMTLAEFNQIQTKIYDFYDDPALGVVLEYIPAVPPVLTSISPNSGPTTGGTPVYLTGFSFISSNTQVFFGSIPATSITVLSNTEIIAIAPPGLAGSVEITVVTVFGTSPASPDDVFTYIESSTIAPPSNFLGCVRKNYLTNHCELRASWEPSPSQDVVAYRVYQAGKLVKEITKFPPYRFKEVVKSKKSAQKYSISAVNSKGEESVSIPIELTSCCKK